MKGKLIFIFILPAAIVSQGQPCQLTGRIQLPATDSVELNEMPFGTNYFKDYSSFYSPDAQGSFHFLVKGDKEKFVLLRYACRELWLLLGPGRPVHVSIDTTKSEVFAFAGKGAPENRLLRQLRPAELYFMQGTDWGKGTNPYMKVSEDSMRKVVFPMVMHSLDSALALVGASGLPARVKEALSTEIRYYYIAQFIKLAWSGWDALNRHMFGFFRIIDTALDIYGIPSGKDWATGVPSVMDYTDGGYYSLTVMKANFGYGYDKNKPDAEAVFEKIYRYSRRDVLKAKDSLGNTYAGLVAARALLPPYVFEGWLTSQTEFWLDDGDFLNASLLLEDLRSRFPGDTHIKPFSQKLAALQQEKYAHLADAHIRFREDGAGIRSYQQLVAPYKGKVVFLDFWGTWCGYCMDEIRHHTRALRERYAGKDVVFLYVAFDDDADKEKWKNDIYLYDMEGEHVRISKKNKAQMDSLRLPLDIGEKEKRAGDYPTYYIFDREGMVVVKNAKRPSEGEDLYRQIDQYLK